MDKISMLIGINYRGTNNELNGCINDVMRMESFLRSKCGYTDITILTDDTPKKPTMLNIMDNLGDIIVKIRENKIKEFFFHYSGHGTYIRDANGDEMDGNDEALVPLDVDEAGLITDDLLNTYISKIPATCKCVFVIDSCHSGSALDLKYRYYGTRTRVIENNKSTVPANTIMISGCRDSQTSADAFISGKWSGAMTASLLTSLENNRYNISCFALLESMKQYLARNGYEQVPQLCSTFDIQNETMFCMSNADTFLKVFF